MNAHHQTPEQLALANEGHDLARQRQYIKLGLAVLMQAVEDATMTVPEHHAAAHGTTDQKAHWNEKRAARDEARAFLTVENSMLSFWCWVAGIQVGALLHYAKRAHGRWEEMGEFLRAHRLHYRKAS